MHGADEQRAPRQRPRADVDVRRHAGMDVNNAAVMMHVNGPRRPLTRRAVDGAQSERHQHQRHAELEQVGGRRRHLGTERHENRTGNDEGRRVPQTPAHAQKCGPAAPIDMPIGGDQRRHGREVIRFERMAHAEQRTETGAGEKFENRHLSRVLL